MEPGVGTDPMVLLCALGLTLSGPSFIGNCFPPWNTREGKGALPGSKPAEEAHCILLALIF